MRSYVIVFVLGVLVALGMTARWQRMGSIDVAPIEDDATPVEASASGITTRARTAVSKASRAVVEGAKADVGRLRRPSQPTA
jgi:hypothetical protein